jgi:hypothetical protein
VTDQAKEPIDAAVLADELLDYGFRPAGQEVQKECSRRYIEELRFLKLFAVDYVLGRLSMTQAGFASVRALYNEGIRTRCAEISDGENIIWTRFEAYTEACNTHIEEPREYQGKSLVFWKLGETFSRLSSDTDQWVPNALEVGMHADVFVKQCVRLSEFLAKYEVSNSST